MQTDDRSLLERFLQHLEVAKGRSPATVRNYELQLERLAAYLRDSDKTLRDASESDLELFAGVHLHRKGVTARARRPAIAAIRGLYRWLFQHGLTPVNVARNLVYPSTGRKLPEALPLQAVEAMLLQTDLDTFLGVRDAAILSLLAGCGLRVSGLVSLTEGCMFSAIDEAGRESAFLRVTEKGDQDRVVPIPPEAWLLVRAYIGHPDLEAIDRSLPDGDRVLFVNTRSGKPVFGHCGEARRLSIWGVRRVVAKYGRLAGVPERYCHPHAFRHLFATELVESEIDLATVQQLLGHKSLDTTKIYLHTAVRKLRAAVDAGSPLAKINTPVSHLVPLLSRGGP